MPFSLPINDAAGIFFVILALMLIAHFLTDRLRLPTLLGFVAAGILAGPSVLDLVARGAVVDHLGQTGLIFAFFLLGADADLLKLKRTTALQAGYALLLALVPALLVMVLLVLGFGYAPGPAFFVALIVASQSLPLTTALQKLGLAKSRPAHLAEGATLATELGRLCIFAAAIVLAGKPSSDAALWLPLALLALLALLLSFALPRLAALFFRRAKANDTIEFIFVLTLAFLCAWLGRLAGLEPFAGAFIAGTALGRFFPERSSLEKRLRFAGEWLFVPFFFVALGMDLDLGQVVSSFRPLALGLGLALLVLLGKGLSGLILRPLAGLSRDEAALAFGLTAGQALSAVAVAGVARSAGAIDDPTLAAVLIASLLTSVAAPLIARAAGSRMVLGETQANPSEEDRPERILVGVSNPNRLDNLVDLAFMLRKRGSAEPIIPVSIVSESEDSEIELSRVESLLAKVIVRGNHANVPIAPATSVAVCAAVGLREAAEEKGATTIVVGWSRAPKFSRAIFGSVIEQILDCSPELIVVARMARPVKEISRVILVLPPLIEHHPGYARALATLSTFLSRTGSHLTIYAQKPGGAAARDAATQLRARGQIQVTELDSWKDVGASARATNGANAAFAVFCVRPGGPAWHPAVEKLPHILEDDFPSSPIILLYLPELPAAPATEHAKETTLPPPDLFAAALDGGRVIPGMTETAITDGIRELLRRSFGDNRKVMARLASQLTEIAQKAAIELEPGVVLLHAHVPEVDEPLVFFGARPEGFRILALESPARILVVLCSPESLPPEAHLATLGEIARLFKDRGLATRLLEARSVSELGGSTVIDEDEVD
jgi:Kef-type K+ transport system membrane component KefB/nucleotide-binding universal stress UspA family protein/mannitol/fructose-specific phosphotransferase system IIA component (Ntr-type)